MPIQINPIGRSLTGIFDQSAAEIPAYDPISQRLFVVNGSRNSIDVIDLSNPARPTRIESIVFLTGGVPTSVTVQGGLLAVAIANSIKTDRGSVVFFDAAESRFISSVTVGSLPDMLSFTPDGNRLVVANEGEPDDSYQIDPEGSVSIIDLSAGAENATVASVDFTAFNGMEAELKASGVRIFGPNASVAQDLEPEFVAIAPDGQTALVTLQENNAIAVVDLVRAEVVEILPLGSKDLSLPGNGIDASDRDGGIRIQTWPVQGLYQPDAIAVFTLNGEPFYLTANEGDARDYSGFSEQARLQSLPLDPTAFPDAATLQQEENLGRLQVTTTLGDLDGDGDYDQIYSFGGRSFSILDSAGELVFDSGDQIEQRLAGLLPQNFNADNDDNDSFDRRSDDQGPEPEGLAVGVVDGRTYAFIGLERVGGILVYDISDPVSPLFVDYFNNRNFSVDVTLPDGTTNPAVGDLGPEGLLFISAEDSPSQTPLLVVTSEVSGSTTIFEITPQAPVPTRVLYVAGQSQPEADDQRLIDRLRASGYAVTVRDDDGISASAAQDQDLIVISESVVSSKVADTFTATDVPLVTWEPFLYDDLGLTGNQANLDFGFVGGQTQIRLADGALQTVYEQRGQVSWGRPNAAAEVIATLENDADRASFFAYDAGATLMGGQRAAANRVGLYLHNFFDEPLSTSETGLDLFDLAIARALGEAEPIQPQENLRVLLVASNINLTPGDAALVQALEARSDLRVTITLQDDDEVSAQDASGQDLILISESVLSGKVGDVFQQTPVPVLTWEPYLYDDFGMTGAVENQDYGAVQGTAIALTPTGVSLEASPGANPEANPGANPGTSGANPTQTIYETPGLRSWGRPTDAATVYATLGPEPTPGDSRASFFAYERGAALANGMTAPAHRVGFFLHDSSSEFARLTAEGLALFNAAVDVALG